MRRYMIIWGIWCMVTLLFCGLLPVCQAQQRVPLGIGEKMQRIALPRVTGSSADSTVIFDPGAGKALILDFGTTGCAPCIKSLLYLDSLQERFPDRISVFFVTREDKGQIDRFVRTNRIGRQSRVPMIYGDTILHQELFPHVYQPHIVLIDAQGVVRAITNHKHLHDGTVSKLLAGEALGLPAKLDYRYDHSSPIVRLDPAYLSHDKEDFAFSMTGNLHGYTSKRYSHLDSMTNMVRQTFINYPLPKLYLSLLGRMWKTSFFPTQVMVAAAGETTMPERDQKMWLAKSVTLEVLHSAEMEQEQAKLRIKAFLDTQLGMDVRLEKRTGKIWVLRDAGTPPIRRDGRESSENFVYRLNQKLFSPFVLQEMEKSRRLEFDDTHLQMDRHELNDLLIGYGLRLDEEERVYEVLVLAQKD